MSKEPDNYEKADFTRCFECGAPNGRHIPLDNGAPCPAQN